MLDKRIRMMEFEHKRSVRDEGPHEVQYVLDSSLDSYKVPFRLGRITQAVRGVQIHRDSANDHGIQPSQINEHEGQIHAQTAFESASIWHRWIRS